MIMGKDKVLDEHKLDAMIERAFQSNKRPPWRPLIGDEPQSVKFFMRITPSLEFEIKKYQKSNNLPSAAAAVRSILESFFQDTRME